MLPNIYKDKPMESQQRLDWHCQERIQLITNGTGRLSFDNPTKELDDEEAIELEYISSRLRRAIRIQEWKAVCLTSIPKVANILREYCWYVKKLDKNLWEIRPNLRNTGAQGIAKQEILKERRTLR